MTNNCKTGRPEQAAIYIRCSTGDPDKFSLQAQKEILTKFATGNGWGFEIYDEGIMSGVTIKDRPLFQRLLDDAEMGRFTVCLVIEFERLTRSDNLLDLALIKGIFREHGVVIQTPGQRYDLMDSEDDFVSDLMGILSKREKRKIAERCKRGMDKAKREGAYLGGIPPMGYRYNWDKRQVEVVEEDAKTIRMIFDMAEKVSAFKIARHLNENNIWTRQGNAWNEPNVRRVFNNLTYAGKRRLQDGTLVDRKFPAIISYEQYERVQLGKKPRMTNVHDTNLKYMLSGLLRCPYCGRSVCSWTDRRKRKSGEVRILMYYVCSKVRSALCKRSRFIKMEAAEQLVVDEVKKALGDEEILKTAYRKSPVIRGLQAMQEEIHRHREKVAEIEKKKGNIINAIAEGVFGPDDAREKMRSLNDQITFAQGRIMSLEKELEAESGSLDRVLFLVRQFHDMFDSADTLRKRELLKAVLEKGELFQDRITLHFRFPVNRDGSNLANVHLEEKWRGRVRNDSAPANLADHREAAR